MRNYSEVFKRGVTHSDMWFKEILLGKREMRTKRGQFKDYWHHAGNLGQGEAVTVEENDRILNVF